MKIVNVEALEVEPLETFVQLILQELWMHAMTGLLLEGVSWHPDVADQTIDHRASRNKFITILRDISTFTRYEKLLSVDIVFSFKHRQNLADSLLALHVPVIWRCVDMVHATTQHTRLDRLVHHVICLIVRLADVGADAES